MASTNNTITGKLQVVFQSTLSGNVAKNDFQSSAPMSVNDSLAFATGTGANQCNIQYAETGTLTASTPVTISLDTDVTRLDGLGNALVLTKVKAIYIKNTNAQGSAGVLTIGAATNPWLGPLGGTTPTISLPAGAGCLLYSLDSNGWAVTPSTAFNLKLAPDANNVNYALYIVGA